jgi:acetylornithine/succinyldiaminopimelate/putrescine aminotransferase
MTQAVADTIEAGDHASTFGANPVVCAAAQVVFTKVSAPEFLEHVREAGSYLGERLAELAGKHDCIVQARGRGLIWALETNIDVAPLIEAGYDAGLLTCSAGPKVLRLLPPLVVQEAELDEAVAILDKAFGLVQ